MSIQDTPVATRHLYELVQSVLEGHIRSGRLQLGQVLLEKPLSDLFQTSRAPIQKALAHLESKALIHRFEGRGYLVGSPATEIAPVRHDIRSLKLPLTAEMDEALQTRGSWEIIYDEVECAVASCLVFGTYRIIEIELAEHFGVSRTVARDVLGRLHERGLVRKGPTSHWLAGPLTAKDMREMYELRCLLEPAALKSAIHQVTRSEIEAMRERVFTRESQQDWPAEAIDEIESELHNTLVLATSNARLAETLRHVQLPLRETERFLRTIGLPADHAVATEHRLIYDLLLTDAIEAAAAALEAHLRAESRRSLALLKTVAVIGSPKQLAPYLKRIAT